MLPITLSGTLEAQMKLKHRSLGCGMKMWEEYASIVHLIPNNPTYVPGKMVNIYRRQFDSQYLCLCFPKWTKWTSPIIINI